MGLVVKMSDDKLNDLLRFGAGFDWITPALDIISGYNTIEYEGWDSDCKEKEKQLRKQGIKCRTQVTGEGWRVISKR